MWLPHVPSPSFLRPLRTASEDFAKSLSWLTVMFLYIVTRQGLYSPTYQSIVLLEMGPITSEHLYQGRLAYS